MFNVINSDDVLYSRAEIIADLLSAPVEFSLDALAARSWVVLPVRDHISTTQARGISRAAKRRSSRRALATTTHPKALPEVCMLSLTSSDILAFDANCMLRFFLLVPNNHEFAILEEANYFYLVAGTEDFLKEAFAASLKTLRDRFLRYASHPVWGDETREWLLGVYERYSGSAAPQ
jgi:hypothetical protein